MTLPSELVSEFAKITNDGKNAQKETTVYGTISVQNGVNYVKLDGSDELTPVTSTVSIKDGERVIVTLKQHQAVVTSNLTDPAASSLRVGEMAVTVDDQGIVLGKHTGDIENIHEALDGIGITISDDKVVIGDHGKLKELNDAIDSNSDDISGISKKITEEIDVKISGLTEFTNGLEDGTTIINGGCIDTNTLNLTGAITWNDLSSGAQDKVTEAANNAVSGVSATANNAWNKLESLCYPLYDSYGNIIRSTYIDGSMIYSGSIYAGSLHLGGSLTVYKSEFGSEAGGYLGYDSGFSSQSGIGMRYSDFGPQVVCTDEAARLSYGLNTQVICGPSALYLDAYYNIFFRYQGKDKVVLDYQSLRPGAAGGTYLGTSAVPWISLWAQTGTIQTSDRNKKNTIEDLPEKYVALFDNLTPRRFKMNSGTSDRYHVGYIAQEVEEAMAAAGVDSKEFAGLIKDVDEDGTEIYMLRYDEFEAIYNAKIKQLETAYEAKISSLEERLAKLEERLMCIEEGG